MNPAWKRKIIRCITTLAVATLAVAGPISTGVSAQDVPTYTVRPGDTLFSIARAHDLSVDQLKQFNSLEDEKLDAGQILLLADPDAVPDTSSTEADKPESTIVVSDSTWRVIRDDGGPHAQVELGTNMTLYELAARFAVHPDTLLALNPDAPDPLPAGAQVAVPANRVYTVAEVRPGDTLYSLGRTFGVSVERIRDANDLSSSELDVGQRLRIPTDTVPAEADHADIPVLETISAAVYPAAYAGRRMANGRPYAPNEFYVSHPDLPIGSIVLLSRVKSGAPVLAVVADRGPSEGMGYIDVSEAVGSALGIRSNSPEPVEIRLLP